MDYELELQAMDAVLDLEKIVSTYRDIAEIIDKDNSKKGLSSIIENYEQQKEKLEHIRKNTSYFPKIHRKKAKSLIKTLKKEKAELDKKLYPAKSSLKHIFGYLSSYFFSEKKQGQEINHETKSENPNLIAIKSNSDYNKSFNLPLYLEEIGFPDNDALFPLRNIMLGDYDKKYKDRFKRLCDKLINLTPIKDTYELDYLHRFKYGLEKGLEAGSCAKEMNYTNKNKKLGQRALQLLNNYVMQSEQRLLAA
jgi:hypothetical protein